MSDLFWGNIYLTETSKRQYSVLINLNLAKINLTI